MKANEITTLEALVEYINNSEEWELEVADIIEANGWNDEMYNDAYKVCSDDSRRVVLNEQGKAEIIEKRSYDVVYNDDEHSDSEGFHQSYEYCKEWIERYNGTGEDRFGDYKGGVVSIYCWETDCDVYEETIK